MLPSGVTFVDNGEGTATLAGTPTSGSKGVYPFTITANNGVSPSATQSFTVTVLGTAVTLTVGANPRAVTQGGKVVITATVSSASGMPTGSVTFSVGGVNIPGCVGVGVVNGVAFCTTSDLGLGNDSVQATYTGRGSFGNAVAAVTVTVGAPVPNTGAASPSTPWALGSIYVGLGSLMVFAFTRRRRSA